MPYCSKEILQGWLVEYRATGPERGRPHVVDQESVDGCDGGLVVYPLNTSRASVYIQPRFPGSLDWCVTIESHPHDTTLSPQRLRELCHEFSAAAVLCDYLQGKALALHISRGIEEQA